MRLSFLTGKMAIIMLVRVKGIDVFKALYHHSDWQSTDIDALELLPTFPH